GCKVSLSGDPNAVSAKVPLSLSKRGEGLSRLHGCALVPRFINTTTFVASIFGSGEARRGSIPRSGAVTEEQRSQNRKAVQPSGRRFFLAQIFVAHSLQTPEG